MTELPRSRKEDLEILRSQVRNRLDDDQVKILTEIWEMGPENIIPLLNLWIEENYNRTFTYAWVACEYFAELRDERMNSADR